MIVVDEYVAVRVLRGRWPRELPDDEELGLPASAHWRLLQALHGGRNGQLSRLFSGASTAVLDAVRWPHPEVLHVIDPRPLLDEAAGLLVGETLAAGFAHGRRLWFGNPANIGPRLEQAASQLGITVRLAL